MVPLSCACTPRRLLEVMIYRTSLTRVSSWGSYVDRLEYDLLLVLLVPTSLVLLSSSMVDQPRIPHHIVGQSRIRVGEVDDGVQPGGTTARAREGQRVLRVLGAVQHHLDGASLAVEADVVVPEETVFVGRLGHLLLYPGYGRLLPPSPERCRDYQPLGIHGS